MHREFELSNGFGKGLKERMWAGFLTKISVHALRFFDVASLFKHTLQQSHSFATSRFQLILGKKAYQHS